MALFPYTDPDKRTLDYVSAFLVSLGKDSGDKDLVRLVDTYRSGTASDAKELATAVADRIEALHPV